MAAIETNPQSREKITMTSDLEQFNPFVEATAVHRELHGGDQYEFEFRNQIASL